MPEFKFVLNNAFNREGFLSTMESIAFFELPDTERAEEIHTWLEKFDRAYAWNTNFIFSFEEKERWEKIWKMRQSGLKWLARLENLRKQVVPAPSPNAAASRTTNAVDETGGKQSNNSGGPRVPENDLSHTSSPIPPANAVDVSGGKESIEYDGKSTSVNNHPRHCSTIPPTNNVNGERASVNGPVRHSTRIPYTDNPSPPSPVSEPSQTVSARMRRTAQNPRDTPVPLTSTNNKTIKRKVDLEIFDDDSGQDESSRRASKAPRRSPSCEIATEGCNTSTPGSRRPATKGLIVAEPCNRCVKRMINCRLAIPSGIHNVGRKRTACWQCNHDNEGCQAGKGKDGNAPKVIEGSEYDPTKDDGMDYSIAQLVIETPATTSDGKPRSQVCVDVPRLLSSKSPFAVSTSKVLASAPSVADKPSVVLATSDDAALKTLTKDKNPAAPTKSGTLLPAEAPLPILARTVQTDGSNAQTSVPMNATPQGSCPSSLPALHVDEERSFNMAVCEDEPLNDMDICNDGLSDDIVVDKEVAPDNEERVRLSRVSIDRICRSFEITAEKHAHIQAQINLFRDRALTLHDMLSNDLESIREIGETFGVYRRKTATLLLTMESIMHESQKLDGAVWELNVEGQNLVNDWPVYLLDSLNNDPTLEDNNVNDLDDQ